MVAILYVVMTEGTTTSVLVLNVSNAAVLDDILTNVSATLNVSSSALTVVSQREGNLTRLVELSFMDDLLGQSSVFMAVLSNAVRNVSSRIALNSMTVSDRNQTKDQATETLQSTVEHWRDPNVPLGVTLGVITLISLGVTYFVVRDTKYISVSDHDSEDK